MFRPARPSHRLSEDYFRSHFDLVDPGITVAPGDTLEDVAALRKALNVCKAIVAERAPVLFEFAEVSKLRNGWDQIDRDVLQALQDQGGSNPRANEPQAWFLAAEMLNRGRRLFDLAWNQGPQMVNVDEAFGQRTFRDLGRSLSKVAFGHDDAEVVRQTQEMCQQFGLTSIRLAGEDQMSPRERSRCVQGAIVDLSRSCKTMGIEQKDFGSGSVSLCIDPHMPQMMGGAGYQRHLGTAGIEIGFAPNQPGVCSNLIHEYVHKLDNSLGLKALNAFNDANGIQGPVAYDDRTMFSNMSSEQRAILPLAKEGVEKIFSTLGAANAKQVDIDAYFDSAAHLLATKTLGVSQMVTAPAPQLQAWIQAIRSDDDSLFRGLASRVTRMPAGAMAHQLFEDHQALNGKPHPFVTMAAANGIGQEKLNAALAKLHPTLGKLATVLHPALPQGMTPSPFLQASVRESVQRASGSTWEVRDALSTPHEVLARVVGRPISAREMSVAFLHPSRSSPLNAEGLKRVNEGFMKMTQADGIRSSADGPRLSSGHEIAVARTATPAFKAIQYASYAVLFLSGQTAKIPKKHARNET